MTQSSDSVSTATGSCCVPSPEGTSSPHTGIANSSVGAGEAAHDLPQVELAGGVFAMGDHFDEGYPEDAETPVRPEHVEPFQIDATSVTNAQFDRFIAATGYTTEAEAWGFSAVFQLAIKADEGDIMGRPVQTPWWFGVNGADWRHPEGRHSDLTDRMDHPVVHVSWNDATAYCQWAGRRLPTEIEWEFAARGGLEGARFPWGNELLDADGQWQCNIWQGRFPAQNDCTDGYLTTAPATTYQPNGYGIYQMVGNAWEWCDGLFNPAHASLPPAQQANAPRAMRGGSFLCHDSYCYRYRVAARSSNTPESSTANIGFRTVKSSS